MVGTVGFEPTCRDGGGFKDRCVYRFHHVPCDRLVSSVDFNNSRKKEA